jgi:hypothetical protein
VRFRRPRYRDIVPLTAGRRRMSGREYEAWRDTQAWDPSRTTELVVCTDLAAAQWIEPLLVPGSYEVRMTVPQGFAAYARIFFPFVVADFVEDGKLRQEYLTWTEVARRNGRTAHALMEQETILRGPGGDSEAMQCSDRLASDQVEAVLSIVSRHTSSSDGWFLLWDGFGDLSERAFHDDGPKVTHPMRSYYLLRGPLSAYGDFPDNPSYWWPDDRAWLVCTDTSFEWAYLAGSADCVAEVIASPVIDALATEPGNPAVCGMDVINDPDGSVPRSF